MYEYYEERTTVPEGAAFTVVAQMADYRNLFFNFYPIVLGDGLVYTQQSGLLW